MRLQKLVGGLSLQIKLRSVLSHFSEAKRTVNGQRSEQVMADRPPELKRYGQGGSEESSEKILGGILRTHFRRNPPNRRECAKK